MHALHADANTTAQVKTQEHKHVHTLKLLENDTQTRMCTHTISNNHKKTRKGEKNNTPHAPTHKDIKTTPTTTNFADQNATT